MHRCIALEIAFKGSRNYLQGGDLLAAALRSLNLDEGFRKFSLTLDRKTGKQPYLIVIEPDENTQTRPERAFARVLVQPQQIKAWIVEGEQDVESRVDFDEDALLSLGRFTGMQAEVTSDQQVNAIELFVAFIKQLHILNFPLSGKEHWAVTQIDLNGPLPVGGLLGCKLAIESRLGTTLTRSDIMIEGRPLATMFFSALPR